LKRPAGAPVVARQARATLPPTDNMRYDLRNRRLFPKKICKFIPGSNGPNDQRDANECSDGPPIHVERNDPDNYCIWLRTGTRLADGTKGTTLEAERLIDNAPAIRPQRLADLEISSPPIGRVFEYLVGPCRLGGRIAQRKRNARMGLHALGLFLRHGTKWYSVVRNSKNSHRSHWRIRVRCHAPRRARKRRSTGVVHHNLGALCSLATIERFRIDGAL
jgi:hypothetical protein